MRPMSASDDDLPPRPDRRKAILVISASVVVVALVLSLVNRGALNLSRHSTPLRTTSSSTPSPTPVRGCQPNQLQLVGAFNSCADQAGSAAPACSPGPAGEVFDGQGHLRDGNYRYILYLEVDGGYLGPGAYTLVPWPHQGLGERDGIAKVAVREFASGTLWQSVAGSLTIEGDQGFVFALLAQPDGGPTSQMLKISGEWYCG